MAALDFPASPTAGQVFEGENGVIYTYVGTAPNGHWSAFAELTSESFNDIFVEVAGDNMTGDLTLGTDKITLNATDGSITAAGGLIELRLAGTLRSKAASSGETHFIDVGTQSDAVYINSTSSGSATPKPLYFYLKEGNTTTTHTFATDGSVKFDGSITAAGSVKIGQYDPSTNSSGLYLNSTGGILSQRNLSAPPTNTMFAGYYGSAQTFIVNAARLGRLWGR